MCNKYKKQNLNKLGNELVSWMQVEKNVWLKDFAINKGFPASYFSTFKKKNEKFKEAYQRAKDIQESRLVKGVLDGTYSPSFVKFILKNEAGWKDKVEETIKEEVPSIQFILTEKKENFKNEKEKKHKKDKEQVEIFNEDK